MTAVFKAFGKMPNTHHLRIQSNQNRNTQRKETQVLTKVSLTELSVLYSLTLRSGLHVYGLEACI